MPSLCGHIPNGLHLCLLSDLNICFHDNFLLNIFSSYIIVDVLFKLFRTHQHFPRFCPFLRPYNAGLAQLIHDPGRPVKTNPVNPLEHADGCFILFNDQSAGFHKVNVPLTAHRPVLRKLPGLMLLTIDSLYTGCS